MVKPHWRYLCTGITKLHIKWHIQDFSDGGGGDGGANTRAWAENLSFGEISAENYIKLKEIEQLVRRGLDS